MSKEHLQKDIFFIALAGIVLFLPFLGGVHLFDWDEINFAEAAREMVLTDNYLQVQIDYQPFWEKPPLFLWLQALSMQVFGIGEYAARFPNAICGILSLLLLYLIGRKHYNRRFGLFWVLAYAGSILPHLYFKSGIIDPWFNLLIFLSLYTLLIFSFDRKQLHYLILSACFAGPAMLTKGPAAFLIIALVLGVNWISERFRFFISIPQFLLWVVIALAVTGLWFGAETYYNGTWFTEEFIKYQWRLFSTPDAGHKGFFGYHFIVLLFGCFPASFFALSSFRKREESPFNTLLKRWMLILFWVVLILFSLVQSKIVHYSSLCYYPLTFLAALTCHNLLERRIKSTRLLSGTILIFTLLIGFVLTLLPFLGNNIEILKPLFAEDPFALANLTAEVQWSYFGVLPGLIFLSVGVLSFYFFKRENIKAALITCFAGTALFVQTGLIFFINNIEAYSQRAAIEFYKSLEGEEFYVATVGFKSYAHLFYSKKQEGGDQRQRALNWLLQGDIDRTTYFVTKTHKRKRLDKEEKLSFIKEENGFVFYKRMPD